MQQREPKSMEYRNRYSIKSLIKSILVIALVFVIFNGDILLAGNFSVETVEMPLLQTVMYILAVIFPMYTCRNIYNVCEDKLEVREYIFFIKITHTEIPFRNISGASIKWSWSKMRRVLCLAINGKPLELDAESCMHALKSEIENKIKQ